MSGRPPAGPPPAGSRTGQRWFLLVVGEWGVANVGHYGVQSILSVYLLTTLQLAPGQAGALILVTSISFRLNRLFLAPVIDRLPPRTAVVGALGIGALGYVAMAFVSAPLAIAVLLPVVGLGGATNALAVKTLAASGVVERSSLLGYASLSTALNVAAAVGPLIANPIFLHWSPRGVFLLAAAAYGVAALMVTALPAGLHDRTERPPWLASIRQQLAAAPMRRALLLTAAGYFFYTQLFATLPIFVTEQLHAEGLRGSFFALNAVLVIAGQLPLGHLAGRRGWPADRLVTAGFLAFGVGFAVLWRWPVLPVAYAAVVLWTVGEMLVMPTLDALVAGAVPASGRTVAFSLAGVATTVGDGLGGVLGVTVAGALIASGAVGRVFGIFAGCALLAAALVALTARPGR